MHAAPIATGILIAFGSIPFLAPAGAGVQDPPRPGEIDEQAELERTSARIAEQLELLRGRELERPVEVRVASQEEFLAYAKERVEELTPPDELAASETMQKMLGALPPDIDLLAVTLEVLEEQVGGFYDPRKDTFYLMEGFTGPVAEIILAHELTHALDDQLFDLDQGLAEHSGSSDALLAYHALVEGSGMVMMTRWMLAHPPRISMEEMQRAMPSPASLGRAPAAIWKPLLASYAQGQAFLEGGRRIQKRLGGSGDMNETLDQAFLSPPRSTEQVLHPEKYWDPEQLDEPREVSHELDALPAAWRVLSTDVLGEFGLALVVEEPEEIDFSSPLAIMTIRYTHPAAEGWDGDEAALLEREDGARLLVLAVVWDSTEDAQQFRAAIEDARGRIEPQLAELAGDGLPSGLVLWGDDARPDLVRLVTFTGLDSEEALELARGIEVSVGPDPLAGPHDAPVPGGSER